MRKVGYAAQQNRYGDESFVRRAGSGEFPRFHIYAEESGDSFVLNIHLDQKKPSYGGTRAHGGEHEGPALEAEVARIKSILL